MSLRNKYKKRAEEKKVPFSLTEGEIKKIKATKKCKYCEKRIFKYKDCDYHHDKLTLDRVYVQKGYTYKNVVACCEECNKIKSKFDHHKLFHLFFKVFKYSRKLVKLKHILGK